ncbi:MAG: hypothetical protein ABIZ91_02750 [Gemmatimonadaceae bacterium]
MSDNVASSENSPESEESAPAPAPAAAPTPPRRGPGHRGQDVRDTMAEMAAKAHEISMEAGSKMAGTMREVIGAAAGLTAFAIESARDLVQYMVRRGQMTQEEADKLMREVEAAHAQLPKAPPKAEAAKTEPAPKKGPSLTAAPVSVSPSALVTAPAMPVEHTPAPPKVTKVVSTDKAEPVKASKAPAGAAAKRPPPAKAAKAPAKSAATQSAATKSAPKTTAKAATKAPAKKATVIKKK